MFKIISILLLQLALVHSFILAADPTPEMKWTAAKSGKSMIASAEKLEDSIVTLITPDGSEIKVHIKHLILKNRNFLKKYFAEDAQPADKAAKRIKKKKKKSGNDNTGDKKAYAVEQGEVSEAIKASADSSYFIYIPESINPSRRPPLLIITHAAKGSETDIDDYIEYAEQYGWVIASSIECNKGNKPIINAEHINDCLSHIRRIFSTDRSREYFAGHGYGGVIAIQNSETIKAAGVISSSAYTMVAGKPNAKYYYFISGARAPTRYATAASYKRLDRYGVIRFHHKANDSPCEEFLYDALFYLHLKALKKSKSRHPEETKQFENNTIAWIEENLTGDSQRAYHAALMLKNDYKISGEHKAKLIELIKKLEEEPSNKLYTDGLEEITKLASKYLTTKGHQSIKNFTDAKLINASKKLLKHHPDTPYITEVLESFMKPTK